MCTAVQMFNMVDFLEDNIFVKFGGVSISGNLLGHLILLQVYR